MLIDAEMNQAKDKIAPDSKTRSPTEPGVKTPKMMNLSKNQFILCLQQ